MPVRRREVECVSRDWETTPLAAGKTRRGAATQADPMVDRLLAGGRLELAQALQERGGPRRGAGPSRELELESEPGEVLVLAVRHPSGALSFHVPSHTERRGGARGVARHRFRLPVSLPSEESARRGPAGGLVKAFVLRVAGKIAGKSLPLLAAAWERASWKRKGLREGWAAVSREALAGPNPLPRADLGKLGAPPLRNLLLLHGTFSNAKAAFPSLAQTLGPDGKDFLSAVQPLYQDRVFAFDHFTVSRSPEENARMLLEALPDRRTTFDCVTHSRGGLVLRHLVERRDLFGGLANRFELGRAVLVASPNGGTPLASPLHFDKNLGWLSGLLELFPDNPFTFALDLVAEGLIWLAHAVPGSLPGLAAMDPAGAVIAALQTQPGPPAAAYSALAANHEPDGGLVQRMVDLGVDLFFNTSNDLVVPTEGGWRVDPDSGASIPGARIGCFGRGGNLAAAGDGAVTHTNFFSWPETVGFLARALRGDPQPVPPLDPSQDLPFTRRRRGPAASEASKALAPRMEQRLPAPAAAVPAAAPATSYEEAFNLAVLPSAGDESGTHLLAAFRNARVVGSLGGDNASQLSKDISEIQKRILAYVAGEGGVRMPKDQELVDMGEYLFEMLFPGDIRRLYDSARALQAGPRLNVVFTSMIEGIADMPWEFAYDPSRKNFLALEDINFVRNVKTAIPADRFEPRPAPLRILVVVAQPLGTAHLSVEDETGVIRSGFHRLIQSGMATVDVLPDATPDALHCKLETSPQRIDVLHFIGHGEYVKENAGTGYLLFENAQGGIQRLDSQVLRQIVCRRGIRLVFLNSCDSGRGGKADFNRGVAPALVAGGVPAVVANQYSVLDTSATSFARHFYWALAQGSSIGDAARESRVAVNHSLAGELIDWAVPVVYARNPCEILCTPGVSEPPEEVTGVSERRARRSEFRGREEIVGLWDVNRVIPDLDVIARSLTESQSMYGFQVVSLSAPLGTWRRRRMETKTEICLRPDEVAKRLGSKPEELGVARLICITSLPLSGAEKGLYSWQEGANGTIAVFSASALLEQVHPPETSVQRMIANAVAGFLGGLATSQRHRKDCPYFYNRDRKIQSIAGPLKLCASCRRKLRKPGQREALEGLLKAY